jgi:hypothetical protein
MEELERHIDRWINNHHRQRRGRQKPSGLGTLEMRSYLFRTPSAKQPVLPKELFGRKFEKLLGEHYRPLDPQAQEEVWISLE